MATRPDTVGFAMSDKMQRSPLVEAICELRFEEQEPLEEARVDAFFSSIAGEFSERATVDEEQITVSLEGSVPKAELKRDRRYRFGRPDGSALVQIGVSVLVINHLPDYGGWELYRPAILRVLRAYRNALGPRSIVHMGLRYINRLHAESSTPKIADLVTVAPSLGGVLKRPIVHFYQRYELGLDAPPGVLIHQTGSRPGEPSLMLDLDVVSQIAAKITDESAITTWLDAAHHVISTAFAESLNKDYYQRLKETT